MRARERELEELRARLSQQPLDGEGGEMTAATGNYRDETDPELGSRGPPPELPPPPPAGAEAGGEVPEMTTAAEIERKRDRAVVNITCCGCVG